MNAPSHPSRTLDDAGRLEASGVYNHHALPITPETGSRAIAALVGDRGIYREVGVAGRHTIFTGLKPRTKHDRTLVRSRFNS